MANPTSASSQSQKVCRTVTLTDEPEKVDAFTSHQRIADAIADLIQPPDAKGISIGIEGSWGSGKSTVARLLVEKLKTDDKNIATVFFDAWAHEGDPLRRTFLETIIRKLQTLNWVDKQRWNRRIKVLARRREVVKTKDRFTITTAGRWIAFVLLLVPIGSAFITAALREDITFHSGPIAWKFLILLLIGLLLTFTPVLVLLKIKDQPDILSLLFNKGPTEKTTQTSRTVNPTSIEFEETFQKLFAEAIGPNKKRIVLILDNLDRVDSKDALSIWSTLQTFLQHKSMERPAWHERLWLLVLYDFRGLSQLWENEKKPGAKTALSFIDKSFQIRFEVPALVPSDWGTFLTGQLEKAFPDHNESDRHEVYRAFAIAMKKGDKPPTTQDAQTTPTTPTIRELKLFVNQIGSIHRQWAGNSPETDTFPLAHIACYVLLRREGDIISELFNPGFPAMDYQDLLGSTVRDNLAGLAFNVEADVARQLLFSDKIKNALMEGSAEELKNVAKLLRRGFWETFEQVATKDWAVSEAMKMAESALAVEESELLKRPFSQSARSVVRSICDGAITAKFWLPMDEKKAKGLAVLLKWKAELQIPISQYEALIDVLFKAIGIGLEPHVTQTDSKLDPKNWVSCVNLVTQELEPSIKQRAFRLVFDTLSDRLPQFTEPSPPDTLPSQRLGAILEALSELQELPEFTSTPGKSLRDLADEGQVAALLSKEASTNPNVVAWIVYILVRYSSEFHGIPLESEDLFKQGEELEQLLSEPMVETFVRILERFKQTALLFQIAKAQQDLRQFVNNSLALAIQSPDAKEMFMTEDGIDRLEFVFASFGYHEEDPALSKLFSEVHHELDLVHKLPLRTFKPVDANLYLLVLKAGEGDQESFMSWCIEGLRSLDDFPLYTRHPLLSLALELHKRRSEFELGERYLIGLQQSIESHKRTGWSISPGAGENLAALIGPLESKFRNSFQDHLNDLIKNTDGDLPVWFFNVFGIELTTQLLHSSNGLKLLEHLPVILKRGEQNGLKWLLDTLTESGGTLEEKYSNEAAWKEFKQAVIQALATQRFKVDTYPLIKSIATTLNILLPRNGLIAFISSDQTRICVLDSEGLETTILLAQAFPILNDSTWSPSGNKLAYTATDVSGKSTIFVLDYNSGASAAITEGSQPSWRSDEQTLAFVRGLYSDIFTINLQNNEVKQLTKDEKNQRPNWSPDGTEIVFNRIENDVIKIFAMKADGSGPSAITAGPKDFYPSWSPDGSQIAFVRQDETVEKGGIYLVDPDYSGLRQLIQENDARAPTWSPDGTKLLYQVGFGSEARIYQIDQDGKNKKELTKGTSPTWQLLIGDKPDSPPAQTPKAPALRAKASGS